MRPRRIFTVLLFVCCVVCGCASFKENVRGLAGISTKVLEEGRKDALKITFRHDYNSCYEKIMKVLDLNKCYVYTSDPKKDMIAIYMSETDTTPVGIFLTSIDNNTTLIEVSSPSTYAKETIAKIIYTAFDKKPLIISGKEEDQFDIKKMFGNQ